MNGEGFGMPAQSVILAPHRRIANFTARCGSQPAARPGQLDVLGAAGHRPVLSPPRVFVTYQVNAFANVDPLLKVRVVGLLGGIGERDLIVLGDGGGAGDDTRVGSGDLRPLGGVILGGVILGGLVLDGNGGILAGIAGNSLGLKRHGRAGGDVGGGNGVDALVIGGDGVLFAGNLEHRLREAIAVIGGHRELEVVLHGHGDLMRRRGDDLVHIRDGGVAQHQLDVGRVGILLRALVLLRPSGLRGLGSAWGGLLLRRRGRRLLACCRCCGARCGRRGVCRRIGRLIGRAGRSGGRGAFHLCRRIFDRGAIAGVHLRRRNRRPAESHQDDGQRHRQRLVAQRVSLRHAVHRQLVALCLHIIHPIKRFRRKRSQLKYRFNPSRRRARSFEARSRPSAGHCGQLYNDSLYSVPPLPLIFSIQIK